MTSILPRRYRAIFHVPHGVPYHVENSFKGQLRAKSKGFHQIDHDMQMTKDGVPVICHWAMLRKDGFLYIIGIDGVKRRHHFGRNARISDLTWGQVKRLRTKDGFRIHAAYDMFLHAARLHLRVMLEVKGDRRFEQREIWHILKAQADRANCDVVVMTLSTLGHNPHARLASAAEAGFLTVALARGPIPRAWESAITWVRGRWVRR